MQLEERICHGAVSAFIEKEATIPIEFDVYPQCTYFLLRFREKMMNIILQESMLSFSIRGAYNSLKKQAVNFIYIIIIAALLYSTLI